MDPLPAPPFDNRRRELAALVARHAAGEGIHATAIAGLHCIRLSAPHRQLPAVLDQGIRVEELASMANLSPSAFHQQFKAVTAMSPLQYQKRLRLTEARQILLAENADAASAAYRVGYQSVSQFSREYARLFGAPPIRDVAGLRGVANAGAGA